jgi:hypothetical protein
MLKFASILLRSLVKVLLAGCAIPTSTGETSRGLIGAWIVTPSYLFVGWHFLSKRGYASGTQWRAWCMEAGRRQGV